MAERRNFNQRFVAFTASALTFLPTLQALVAEMVGNFGKRLKPFDMTVKELTGDMNLSRAEIEAAQACSCRLTH